jgi:hypothetical protein
MLFIDWFFYLERRVGVEMRHFFTYLFSSLEIFSAPLPLATSRAVLGKHAAIPGKKQSTSDEKKLPPSVAGLAAVKTRDSSAVAFRDIFAGEDNMETEAKVRMSKVSWIVNIL